MATALLALAMLPGGCDCRGTARRAAEEAQREREQRAIPLIGEGRRYAEELRGASNAALLELLKSDSANGAPPMASPAYRETLIRGTKIGSDLRAGLTDDASSLLALLALNEVLPDSYLGVEPKVRSKILVESLKNARYMNAWGVPHMGWERPARLLIAEGATAVPLLMPLLDDTRTAPAWGSEIAAESAAYAYRMCDYAWALLVAIRGQPGSVPQSRSERDKLIDAIRVPPKASPP